jgi:uncharacterized protein YqgV (UPF0045/DUF77 family)
LKVQAEVSLYPLRTGELAKSIDSFVKEIEEAGLALDKGSMSSIVAGDVREVFDVLGRAFETVAGGCQVVMVLKISNACPSTPARGTGAESR